MHFVQRIQPYWEVVEKMENTAEQARAERLFLRYCAIARLGGRIQLRKLLETGFAASYPDSIEVVKGLEAKWIAVAAVLSEAIETREGLKFGTDMVWVNGATFLPRPWLPAFEAVATWHEIFLPSAKGHIPAETPTDEERLAEITAVIPTTYVGLELTMLLDEVRAITEQLGWHQGVGDAPKGGWHPLTPDVTIEDALSEIANNQHARLDVNSPETSWVCLTPKSAREHRSHKILDIRWVPVFEALIQRNKNLEVTIPSA